jgi:hypothetical protein
MKYYLIALLFTVQYSFAQNFDYKVISENPNFQISFPALPDSQTISHKEYFAVQYSLLHKNTAYSFSVLTIPDSIEDKQFVMNSIHVGFKKTMDVFVKKKISLTNGISGYYYEGISKKVNTLARFNVYFHDNRVYFLGLSRAGRIPSKKLFDKFSATLIIE